MNPNGSFVFIVLLLRAPSQRGIGVLSYLGRGIGLLGWLTGVWILRGSSIFPFIFSQYLLVAVFAKDISYEIEFSSSIAARWGRVSAGLFI